MWHGYGWRLEHLPTSNTRATTKTTATNKKKKLFTRSDLICWTVSLLLETKRSPEASFGTQDRWERFADLRRSHKCTFLHTYTERPTHYTRTRSTHTVTQKHTNASASTRSRARRQQLALVAAAVGKMRCDLDYSIMFEPRKRNPFHTGWRTRRNWMQCAERLTVEAHHISNRGRASSLYVVVHARTHSHTHAHHPLREHHHPTKPRVRAKW